MKLFKSRLSSRTILALPAFLAMTAQVCAAPICDAGAAAALKTAAVQQEMMVAGLTCGDTDAYNRFVLTNQTALQQSDAALMNYFRSRDGDEAGYDSYKTKLANLAAGRSAANGARYCAAVNADFAAARDRDLVDFIARDHLLIATPESCAIKYDRVDVALAGPSYDLPATPYGDTPPRRAQAADPRYRQAAADPDQDYTDLPLPPRYPHERARDNDDSAASYYGPPPGWLQRPRYRDPYQRSVYNDD